MLVSNTRNSSLRIPLIPNNSTQVIVFAKYFLANPVYGAILMLVNMYNYNTVFSKQ